MERSLLISLIAFLLFAVLENIISTVVGSSLIFYIESVGGTKDDYGLTTSSVCIGATLMIFYFGKWVDSNGNKYQAPLACAFILGIVGSIIYFLASVLPRGYWAVNAILLGRFIQGMGAAGKLLTRSWVATAIPFEKQKSVFSVLTMVGNYGPDSWTAYEYFGSRNQHFNSNYLHLLHPNQPLQLYRTSSRPG